MKPVVVVALSGGVDSAVSAYLLKKQGYKVLALYMKNWEDCPEEEYQDVMQICKHLAIDYYTLNFTKEYQEEVFSHFLREYKMGRTPNPDILCNREIKFKVLLDKALQLGDFLATGHYARIDSSHNLLRGLDETKDQSYFLYTLKKSQLEKVMFPLGDLKKATVREIAKEINLPVHAKKDSTGICFIGERKFKEFLSNYIGFTQGDFANLKGEKLGTHDGMAFYTIGQRKGIKLGGKGDAWYVVGKDPKRNVVYIEQGKDHPSLFSSSLLATEVTWVNEEPTSPQCTAKIRYRTEDAPCILTKQDEGTYRVDFLTPQRAITEGQSVVFYQGEVTLGGGVIAF